jgi:hypothetical protein
LQVALDPANKHYAKHWVWFKDPENKLIEDVWRIVVALPNDGLPIYKRGGKWGKDCYMMSMQLLNLLGASNLPDQTHMLAGILDTEDGTETAKILDIITRQIDEIKANGLTVTIAGTERHIRCDFIPKADLSMVSKIFKGNLGNSNHVHPYMFCGGKTDYKVTDATIGEEGSGCTFIKTSYEKCMEHHLENEEERKRIAIEMKLEVDDDKVHQRVKKFARHEGAGDDKHSNYQVNGPPLTLAKYPIFFCDMHAAANEAMDLLERAWEQSVHRTEDPERAAYYGDGDTCHEHEQAPTKKFIEGTCKIIK